MWQAAQPRAGRCLHCGRMVGPSCGSLGRCGQPHLRLPHADAQAADVPQPGLRRGERLDQPCGLVAPLPLLHVHHLRARQAGAWPLWPAPRPRMGEARLDELAWTAPAPLAQNEPLWAAVTQVRPMGRQGRG